MSKEKPSVPATPADPGVTMTFSVRDRLIFGSVFPEQGNLLEMKIVKAIERKIELGAEELGALNYRDIIDPKTGQPSGRVKWEAKKEKPLTVSLSGIEIDFLKKVINRLSGENKIRQDFAELAIKIDEAKKGA
jgi:hypothetical protein